MLKIKEEDFVNFTIVGNGWSLTVTKFKTAQKEWENIGHGQLVGNKHNGDKSIIDSR